MTEEKAGAISYATLGMLKERGLTTHFLAFVAVFCKIEGESQRNVDQYIEWAEHQPIVKIYKKQPTQKQWVEKFQMHAPEFLKL